MVKPMQTRLAELLKRSAARHDHLCPRHRADRAAGPVPGCTPAGAAVRAGNQEQIPRPAEGLSADAGPGIIQF